MTVEQITKIALTWELYEQGVAQIHIAKHVGVDRRTVYRWIQGVHHYADIETYLHT